ncbi:hypothetical protein N7470_004445 [Penicillium chermesinum]|nr:hypothetical protein N7470_004445 [Penicillium chermesinum]
MSFWHTIFDQGYVTEDIVNHKYDGSGTEEDPWQVTWMEHDARDPMNYGFATKWLITLLVGVDTLAIALTSSAYSGGIVEVTKDFNVTQEIGLLGIALFVLGFAVGPLVWAPLSEVYGRRYIMIASAATLTAFTAATTGAQNIQTLIVLRFFAGAAGSAPGLFCAAPFLGPALGPIIGGFLSESAGWRWVEGAMAIVSAFLGSLCVLFLPETYAPVLLRKRAQRLAEMTGDVYRSKLDISKGRPQIGAALKEALSRPWILLFREPIVLLLSIYLAIVYGILYMLFAAFPIVYAQERGWSEGMSGLAFVGVLVGIIFSAAAVFPNFFWYRRKTVQAGGRLAPEMRLPASFFGAIILPAGIFWFAWTNDPSNHWAISIAAGVPLGFGMVMVFLPVLNYLIDAYTIFSASVLAANASLRSMFGFAFPLFTTPMFKSLGIHWGGLSSGLPGGGMYSPAIFVLLLRPSYPEALPVCCQVGGCDGKAVWQGKDAEEDVCRDSVRSDQSASYLNGTFLSFTWLSFRFIISYE